MTHSAVHVSPRWGDQDGGPGHKGTVTSIQKWRDKPGAGVNVTWDSNKGFSNVYRNGYDGKFDVVRAAQVQSTCRPPAGLTPSPPLLGHLGRADGD